jgi:hypothetical protein
VVQMSLSCTTSWPATSQSWGLTPQHLCRYIDDAMDAEAYESQTFDECEQMACCTAVRQSC